MSIFNLGEPSDYRIPDGGLLHERTNRVYALTAALIVEIISSGDNAPKKIPLYAEHGVEELVIVDPQQQRSNGWHSDLTAPTRPPSAAG